MPATPQNSGNQLITRETVVGLVAGPKQVLVESNPNRVYLLFSTRPDNLCTISAKSDIGTVVGIPLDLKVTWEVTWRKHGSLVISQWYGSTDAGATVYIQEVLFQPK